MGAYSTESITVSNAVKTFTDATINPGDGNIPFRAVFAVEGDQIRFRVDGGDPSTTVGMLAETGDIITIEGEHDIENFKAIRVNTDATIQPIYFNGLDVSISG